MKNSKLKQKNSKTQAKNSRFRQIHLVYLPKTRPKKKAAVIIPDQIHINGGVQQSGQSHLISIPKAFLKVNRPACKQLFFAHFFPLKALCFMLRLCSINAFIERDFKGHNSFPFSSLLSLPTFMIVRVQLLENINLQPAFRSTRRLEKYMDFISPKPTAKTSYLHYGVLTLW